MSESITTSEQAASIVEGSAVSPKNCSPHEGVPTARSAAAAESCGLLEAGADRMESIKDSPGAIAPQNEEERLLLEMQRRRVARCSLLEWATLCQSDTNEPPAKHHRYLLNKLEEVVKGRSPKKKVMIFMPPGSAKSTYASVVFPPWFLAQNPNKSILACSHSHNLVESFGRRCRNNIDLHGATLGLHLCKDSQAAGEWAVENGGLYFCAGVGAGIAGHRADLAVIDDPIGKKEDADSKNLRDKQWDWYQWDFKKRLKPGATVILIQTRWHEDDLAGRLLDPKEPNNEIGQWEVVKIPLIAGENDLLERKPGESLWPEHFDKTLIADRVRSPGYFAQEQQEPAPDEGNMFTIDMLQGYAPQDLPKGMRYYEASDHALKEDERACKSCIGIVGVDHNDNLYILPDIFWKVADTLEQVEKGIDLGIRYKVLNWWLEKENIAKAIGPFLKKRMRERGQYIATSGMVPSRDTVNRVQSFHARCAQKKVFFPKFASWWADAEHELLMFPAGKTWDFVSMVAMIGLGLDKVMRGDRPTVEIDETPIPFKPTVRWLKNEDRRSRMDKTLAMLDN